MTVGQKQLQIEKQEKVNKKPERHRTIIIRKNKDFD